MVRSNLTLTIFDEEEGKSSFGDFEEVARFDESRLVGHNQPLFGKDSPSL